MSPLRLTVTAVLTIFGVALQIWWSAPSLIDRQSLSSCQ